MPWDNAFTKALSKTYVETQTSYFCIVFSSGHVSKDAVSMLQSTLGTSELAHVRCSGAFSPSCHNLWQG